MRGNPEFSRQMQQQAMDDAFKAEQANRAEQAKKAAEKKPKNELRKFGETIELEESSGSLETVKPEEMTQKKEGIYKEPQASIREVEFNLDDSNESLKLVGEKEDDVIELTDADLVEEPSKKPFKN